MNTSRDAGTQPTPHSSTSSPNTLYNDKYKEPKQLRRPSLQYMMADSPIENVPQAPLLTAHNSSSQLDFEDECNKDPCLDSSESLRRRIIELEKRLQGIECSKIQDFPDRADEGSERSDLILEPQRMTWQEYLEPTGKATHFLEVLIEKPHTVRRKSSMVKSVTEAPLKLQAHFTIERLRIRSPHIISALQTVTEQTFASASSLNVHRPFKIFLFYETPIEEHLAELSYNFQHTYGDLCDECKGVVDQKLERLPNDDSESHGSHDSIILEHAASLHSQLQSPITVDYPRTCQSPNMLNKWPGSNNKNCTHEISYDLLVQREAIAHLQAMVEFMKRDLKEVFAKHRLLRSSEPDTVAWADLRHLFQVGDLVVTDHESNAKTPKLYKVIILPVCDCDSGRRPVKKLKLRSDGSHQQVESVYKEGSINTMNIDLYCYDFDGRNFGPVETRVTVVKYDGQRKITDLPLYPLRFHKDPHGFKSEMLARAEKFLEFCSIAHREYTGLSLIEPQEQIDSQVIIDTVLAYRKHPENAPKFGLKSWREDSSRVVTETCGVSGCTECLKGRFIFDDHRIDRQRTVEFIKQDPSLLTTFSDSRELTQDMKLILPSHVFGFVLRSRRWYDLEIDKVRPIQHHNDGFENLIFPSGSNIAKVVEALVQTHDGVSKPTVAGHETERIKMSQEHQSDIVRGKGKGLIILLHGAPGVGKSSTAECVADYTRKPLFPITCGDIGESAKEVEQNLEQHFQLAHRWGCILLLDEADVFLQARDRENMTRNSIVSVFLRVLEYYFGILILTTNKIGHFDEAFKSRIHVSLLYPPLDKKTSIKIWKMNLKRLIENKKDLEVDQNAIIDYAKRHYKSLSQMNRSTWNGRQIKNAFQTAIALAQFDAKKDNLPRLRLTIKHFNVVAQASEGFDEYLSRIHGGNDADRARRDGQRDDDPFDNKTRSMPFFRTQRPSDKFESADSSSMSGDFEVEKRARKKRKRGRKRAEQEARKKVKSSKSESSSYSTSSEEMFKCQTSF